MDMQALFAKHPELMSDEDLITEIERRDPEGTKSDLHDPSTEEAELYRIADRRGLFNRA